MTTQVLKWARWAGLAIAAWTVTLDSRGLAQGAPTPGPEHQFLKRLEGEWVANIKSPGGDSTGSATYKVICGGFWVAGDFHAEFGGEKFHGHGLDGYDPEKKKFVSAWVDSMGAQLLVLEGTLDEAKKVLTMRGQGPGPDGKPVKYRNETRFKDADHLTFVMNVVAEGGQEAEVMTIEYTRKK